jgi:hypothetical protein
MGGYEGHWLSHDQVPRRNISLGLEGRRVAGKGRRLSSPLTNHCVMLRPGSEVRSNNKALPPFRHDPLYQSSSGGKGEVCLKLTSPKSALSKWFT